jgi:hypothetical protein
MSHVNSVIVTWFSLRRYLSFANQRRYRPIILFPALQAWLWGEGGRRRCHTKFYGTAMRNGVLNCPPWRYLLYVAWDSEWIDIFILFYTYIFNSLFLIWLMKPYSLNWHSRFKKRKSVEISFIFRMNNITSNLDKTMHYVTLARRHRYLAANLTNPQTR